jgi:hypothetical protein
LLRSCVRCFQPDVLDLSLASVPHGPRCRFCGSQLPILVACEHGPWSSVLHLQHAILACLRGQRPPRHWAGACTARAFVRLIGDLVDVVTSRDSDSGLVLADLLPNAVRWDHRPLRWRVPHGLHTAATADRLVILGAVSTILRYRAAHRGADLEDPLAVLWPALSVPQQRELATKAGRWPADTRARLHRVAAPPRAGTAQSTI